MVVTTSAFTLHGECRFQTRGVMAVCRMIPPLSHTYSWWCLVKYSVSSWLVLSSAQGLYLTLVVQMYLSPEYDLNPSPSDQKPKALWFSVCVYPGHTDITQTENHCDLLSFNSREILFYISYRKTQKLDTGKKVGLELLQPVMVFCFMEVFNIWCLVLASF
jgi:hypothetical protein